MTAKPALQATSRPEISKAKITSGRSDSIPTKLMLQFGFCPLQPIPLGFGQGLAGSVNVECQHRKRGAVGAALAARAVLCRALEGSGDLLRIGQFEDAALEIKRTAFPRDALRPALRCSGFCRGLFRSRRFFHSGCPSAPNRKTTAKPPGSSVAANAGTLSGARALSSRQP